MGGTITPADLLVRFNSLTSVIGLGIYPSKIDFTAMPPKINYVWRSEYALVPGSILTIPRVLTSGNEAELIPFTPLGNEVVKQLPTVVRSYRELETIIDSTHVHTRRFRYPSDIISKIDELLAEVEDYRETERGADLRLELGLYCLSRNGTYALKTAAEYFFQAAKIYTGLGLHFRTAMLSEIGALTNAYMIEEGNGPAKTVSNYQAPSAMWAQAIKRPIGQVENIVPIFLSLAHSIISEDWETAKRSLEASIEYRLSNNSLLPLDDRIRIAWATLGGGQHIAEKAGLVTQDNWKLSSKIMISVADEWVKRDQYVAQIPELRALAEQAALIGKI